MFSVYHTGRRFTELYPTYVTSARQKFAEPFSTPPWLIAARAAESKKATDIRVLDLREVTSFADFFVVCTGSNPKQIQAITEEIGRQLDERGEYPVSVEGFENAEWVLADYGDYSDSRVLRKGARLLRSGSIVAPRENCRSPTTTPDRSHPKSPAPRPIDFRLHKT